MLIGKLLRPCDKPQYEKKMKKQVTSNNKFTEVQSFEPMNAAEAEKVIGGKKIKIMHVNPDGSTTVIKISY